MNCEEVKELLDEYICGELDREQSRQVKEHLDTCDRCRMEYEQLKTLKKSFADLAEPVPEDFNDKLMRRIRGEKRHAFINRISAGVAAAVVLVCVIGIGYRGYNSGLEDKMKALSGSEINTQECAGDTARSGLNPTKDTTQQETVQADVTEEVTGQRKSTEVMTETAKSREAVTEQVTELVTERAGTQGAVNVESTPAEKGRETITEAADEVTSSDLVQADDHTEEEGSSVEISDMALPESAPAVASARSIDVAMSDLQADVNLIVTDTDIDTLVQALSGAEEIVDIQVEDNTLSAKVEGMSYEDFRELLSDFDVTEEGVYTEEGCLDYSVKIRVG